MISDERLHEIIDFAESFGRHPKLNECAEMAKDLLSLRNARVIPDGWKLVPVEPTEEMITAGDQFMDGLSRLGDAYEAMLAAAPED